MKLFKKAIAELIGTCVLVTFACGVACALSLWSDTSALDSAAKDGVVALAFGLCIVAMAYSVGNVSGCHVNPAVSFGVLIYNYLQPKEKRNFSFVDFLVYIVAQCAGSFLGCGILYLIFGSTIKFGANQASALLIKLSPDYYVTTALAIECLLTFVFVFVVIGVTSQDKYKKCSGIVIGLTLTLVHLFGIPLTGTSVNPARSIGPAVMCAFINGDYEPLNELWVFIVGPMLGALIAALVYWFITYSSKKEEPVAATAAPAPAKVEEKKEEPVKEEKPAPAKKEEKVVPVVEEKEEEDEEGESNSLDIVRVSFVDKLKKADKDLKSKYEDIKKEFEAYGVKSRISFEGDTYRLHKVEYAFITIRGKSLKVYYKLKPKDYVNSPIPVKDEGKVKKYKEVPACLKVKSDLSSKRAISLIEDTMKAAKIERIPTKEDKKEEVKVAPTTKKEEPKKDKTKKASTKKAKK